jgi:hypothetical protein
MDIFCSFFISTILNVLAFVSIAINLGGSGRYGELFLQPGYAIARALFTSSSQDVRVIATSLAANLVLAWFFLSGLLIGWEKIHGGLNAPPTLRSR